MNWKIKLVRNIVLGKLPFLATLRRLKRSVRPHVPDPAIDAWTVEQGIRQVELIRRAGFSLNGKTALELGTGWQPIIPILLSLAGCSKVIMVDAQKLLDVSTFCLALKNLRRAGTEIALRIGISQAAVQEKLKDRSATDLQKWMNQFGLEYRAPSDAGNTGLPDASLDLITSRAVLEHIPPHSLPGILAEFGRILKPDGASCHIIDNSDHWEHGDKSISRLNFLKHSSAVWKLVNVNPLDYQNRLRHSEYLSLFKNHGFRILRDESEPDRKALEAVGGMRLSPKYQSFNPHDLAVLTSYLVLAPERSHELLPVGRSFGMH